MRLFGTASVLIALVIVIWQPISVRALPCLQLAGLEDAIGREVGEKLEHIFAGHDPCLSVQYMPASRSEALLLSGQIDGDFPRLPEFAPYVGAKAVMVPVPLISGEGVLVTSDPAINSVDDLGAVTLGLRRGTKWSSEAAGGHINRIFLPSYDIVVDMFLRRRLDAFLIESNNLKHYEAQLASATKTVVRQGHAYLWLSKKNEKYLPEITRVLTQSDFQTLNAYDQ
ncbi:ABC transporter substrate-binding protein [Thalassospira sp. ER-Se-21-Dark]|uniref:ABC transporter substrate-binding protein n=1 Tax=Thalassospira sp. ER-Se-21-Dark TaxID=2585190 RepID=UPI001B301C3C|nr:ABC transporter substrate-binding protein [Thalassospira sp. ER-Se-21-Dark]MBP3127920.1 ABC transporter substrate-binding protein [Thalassospira sp. ER-Se-21-Dark]